jgi:hypothetical protein
MRGADGAGLPALRCATCHQQRNTPDGRVPGVLGWRLPPVSMHWEGLTRAEICESIKDPKRNGGRKQLEVVIEHMKTDPLVLWAWSPGGNRTLPPSSHEQFVKYLEAWVAAGGPCPSK